tara:strand:+ start:267 stop:461 length:195 start_codon:yes stop_codon:yes gene_type:complete
MKLKLSELKQIIQKELQNVNEGRATDEVIGNLKTPLGRMLQYDVITLNEYNAIMEFVKDLLKGR